MKTRRALGTCLATLFPTVSLISSLSAELLVYEGFQYGPPGSDQDTTPGPSYNLLHNQPDGEGGDIDATGLSGTWQDFSGPQVSTDLFLNAGSLSFGNLETSGNHVRTDTNNNNDRFSRGIQADLDAGATLWFSVLVNKLQNNFSAAEGGLVIGNQAVNNPRVLLDDGSTGLAGFGFAPTTAGNNWTPYAWNGTSQTVGDAVYGVPTNGSETNLMVGKVTFNTGAGDTDQYTLYYYDKSVSNLIPDELNLIAVASTIEVDIDETALNTLSLTRQVNTAWDEIRIGTTLADVLPAAAAGNGYDDWIAGFAVGGASAFDDDADGDGLDNGVEAFFGTAPDSPNSGLSGLVQTGSDLSFTHPQADPALDDVGGSYEWSLDLTTWNDSGDSASGATVTFNAQADTPATGTTSVTASVSGTAPDKVFIRVVAEQVQN